MLSIYKKNQLVNINSVVFLNQLLNAKTNSLLSFVNASRFLTEKNKFTNKNCDFLKNKSNSLFHTNSNYFLRSKINVKWLADKIGTDLKEVKINLNYFRQNVQNIPFALFQVNNQAVKNGHIIEDLVESLAFLHQNEMRIVLVIGNNIKIDDDLLNLKINKNISESVIIKLMQEFSKYNIKTMPIFNGNNLLKCSNVNQQLYQGKIDNVDLNLLDYCFKTQQIPIVNSIGENTTSNQYLFLDINHTIHSLALKLNPFKIINLNPFGGLRDSNNNLILNINIPKKCDNIPTCTNQIFRDDLNITLDEIRRLLLHMPTYTSYIITNVNNIIGELFTNTGRGTFFKISDKLIRADNLNSVDIRRIKNLIENSFERRLKDDYFEELSKRRPLLYITENYSALAIVTRELDNYGYLDKFCVAPENQGHGVADLLWDEIKSEFSYLFWRSRLNNPINWWYFRRAQGSWQTNKWILFWYGINDPKISSEIIKHTSSLHSSFIDEHSSKKQKYSI